MDRGEGMGDYGINDYQLFETDITSDKSLQYRIKRVTSPMMRREARDFINAHHSYIKWADRPSRKLYWNLFERGTFVGVFGLGSAFVRPKLVMDYMESKGLGFNEVGNNIVYSLHGQEDRNAGTRFLRLLRIDGVKWWRERYGDKLKAFQTFILPPRTGALYKADNWTCLGMTTGLSQQTRTIRESEVEKCQKVERRVFKSGEIRYTDRTFIETAPKLIFMREV